MADQRLETGAVLSGLSKRLQKDKVQATAQAACSATRFAKQTEL